MIRIRAKSVQGGHIQGEMVYPKDVYRVQQGAFFKTQLQQLVSLLKDMDVSIAPMERLYTQNTHLEKHLGSAKRVQKVLTRQLWLDSGHAGA